MGLVLAVCGGGGDDAVALVVILAVVAAWLFGVAAIVRGAGEATERSTLILVLAIAVVLGAAIFLGPEGVSGDGDYLLRFLLALLIPAAVGGLIAFWTRGLNVGRGMAIALAGAILVPGGLFVLLFSSLLIGSGCLE